MSAASLTSSAGLPTTVSDALATFKPDVVVNAAAYTAVDKAESEAEIAFAINGRGAGHVAAASSAYGVPLIHISTDYVFDGSKPDWYRETDPVAPLGVYGQSKLDGERHVITANARHIVLRTSWVYSEYGANFVKTMLRVAQARDDLGVVDDQRGSPTYASHLAAAILDVAGQVVSAETDEHWGVYHASGSGEATWCEVARAIFAKSERLGGPTAVVRSITTADYPTPAKRPANSRLDCSKLKQTFNIKLPDWHDGVAACVRALLNESDDHSEQGR